MSTPRKLLQNCLYIPEQDLYLKSAYRHDYVSVDLDDTTHVSTDGGLDYLHRSFPLDGRVVEWDLYEDDPFETIAARLVWGTRGKNGKSPLRHRPLASFALDHLQAILKTQPQIKGTIAEKVVKWWIENKSPTTNA